MYTAQGKIVCQKETYENPPQEPTPESILPDGDYKNSCSSCKNIKCKVNYEPTTCLLYCDSCTKDSTGTTIPSKFEYVIGKPVYNYDGELMNEDMYNNKIRLNAPPPI